MGKMHNKEEAYKLSSPSDHREYYDKPVMIEELVKLNDLEVFVYNHRGEIVNIKDYYVSRKC